MSPDKPSDLHDCRETSPGVAGRLTPLAPCLAPWIGRRRVHSGESEQSYRGYVTMALRIVPSGVFMAWPTRARSGSRVGPNGSRGGAG